MIKQKLLKLLCAVGVHDKKGYPHGLDNGQFQGVRVNFRTCSRCGKRSYKVVEVNYSKP
jgi:hypothetical protein